MTMKSIKMILGFHYQKWKNEKNVEGKRKMFSFPPRYVSKLSNTLHETYTFISAYPENSY